LNRVRHRHRPFLYWFQKYTIDGIPEWETPAVDQTAMIPWGLERHYRRTGDLDLVTNLWAMVEQAAEVCCGNSGGHPGLKLLPDLNLISSAGSGDQLFAASLYSNACVVAGLRSASRLANILGHTELAQQWSACADRVWFQGIMQEVTSADPTGPGLIDPELGRFLHARRLSNLKGGWTNDPASMVERSAMLDVGILGLAVPYRLLPASDPRLMRTAENLLGLNTTSRGDTNLLSRMIYDPPATKRRESGGSSQHDVSSLATLWMARYLLQLGRETGQSRHITRAMAMLEAVMSRLTQLGLVLRSAGPGTESARRVANPGGTAWRLHAMLIDTVLDIAGLDYDVPDRRLNLRPTLPGSWPQTGLRQLFDCGEVTYGLERPIGGRVYHMTLRTRLRHPVTLEVEMSCPELKELGPWQSSPPTPEPTFDRATRRINWTVSLPSGDAECQWTWG
jgi:hypothetical protein